MEENGAINAAIESTYDVDDAKYAGQQQLPPTPQNVAREDIREFFRMNPLEFFGGLDLIMLKQSSMSASEYVEKYEDMAANSRKMVYAPDERWEIDQFLFGLKADI
ncbi:hypothetical protein KIW84_065982 [Lathyrus oleraceus]|uniref:Retrotransposon gag domain-containing protein n=1 Tax=Pisum sativum TaxID=3888 RepID=A0A9D4WFS7_PEA|nr:hypothetical protein KIW84_065982 [Pisum sativum]